MLAADLPTKFNIPFANNAGGSFIRNVPEASQIGIINGAASLYDGFVPLNALPVAAGGIPPFIQDTNGILFQISSWVRWMAAGGIVPYDAVFQTAIGGYPAGALIGSANIGGIWLSLVDDNTSDPDTGGANWLLISSGRLIDVQVFDTAGSYTYTAAVGVNIIEVEGCGGAGAGGGTALTGVGQVAVGGGGGAGGSGWARITDATTFNGAAIVIGVGGTAVSGANGNNGIASSFGSFLALPGGGGGIVGLATVPPFVNGGSNGAVVAYVAGCQALRLTGGESGDVGFGMNTANVASGLGGSCLPYGTGGQRTAPGAGGVGTGAGAGGSGASSLPSTAARAGGNGLPGKLIIRGFSG